MSEAAKEKSTFVPVASQPDDLSLEFFGMTKNQNAYYYKKTHKCTENKIERLSDREIYEYDSLEFELDQTLTREDKIQQLYAVAKILKYESRELGKAKKDQKLFEELSNFTIDKEWLVYSSNEQFTTPMFKNQDSETNHNFKQQAREQMRGDLARLDRTKFEPLMLDSTEKNLELVPELILAVIIALKIITERNKFVIEWISENFGNVLGLTEDMIETETPESVLERVNDYIEHNRIYYVGDLLNLARVTDEIFKQQNGPTMADYWLIVETVNKILLKFNCYREVTSNDCQATLMLCMAQNLCKILVCVVPARVPLNEIFTLNYFRREFRAREMVASRRFGIQWFNELQVFLIGLKTYIPKNILLKNTT